MTTSTPVPTAHLPEIIRTYLAEHAAGRADTAIRAFATGAVVVDEGRTYRGTEEVLGFLRAAGSPYTFTTTLVGAERVDDEHWVAVQRLDGDFPGGTAELRYRTTLVDGLIGELVIAS